MDSKAMLFLSKSILEIIFSPQDTHRVKDRAKLLHLFLGCLQGNLRVSGQLSQAIDSKDFS